MYLEANASAYQTAYAEPGTACMTREQGHAFYRGFIGPLCMANPPSPPSPPPSPRYRLEHGGRCLGRDVHAAGLRNNAWRAKPTLIACDAPHTEWQAGVDGFLLLADPAEALYLKMNESAPGWCEDKRMFLNPDEPGSGATSQGFRLRNVSATGPRHAQAGFGVQLPSSICPGHCLAGIDNSGTITLDACDAAGTTSWLAVPVPPSDSHRPR